MSNTNNIITKQIFETKKEEATLTSTMMNLRVLKPLLYSKMKHTGDLAMALAQALNLDYNEDFKLASYYCNLGFLAIENSIYKDHYVNDYDRKIIKRHPIITADLMSEKGLEKVSYFTKYHHEKPDGTGFYKEQIKDKYVGVLCIADEFIESILPSKSPESSLVFDEAVEFALKGFGTFLMFRKDEVKLIKKTLETYYFKNIRI